MISKIIHPWLYHPISPLQPSFNSNHLHHHHIWKIKIFHAFHHQHKTPILQRCSTPVHHFTQRKQPPKLSLYSLVWSSDFTSHLIQAWSKHLISDGIYDYVHLDVLCFFFLFLFFLNNLLKPWRYVLYRKEGKFFIFYFGWKTKNMIFFFLELSKCNL